MLTRLAKHRTFQYQPHYYKPEEDQKRRSRIRFQRRRHRPRRASTLGLILLLAFVVYLLHLLSQLAK